MLLIITSTGDKLLRNVNIDDLEWSRTSKILIFMWFFGNSCLQKSELRRNGWRQTKITCEQELPWALARLLSNSSDFLLWLTWTKLILISRIQNVSLWRFLTRVVMSAYVQYCCWLSQLQSKFYVRRSENACCLAVHSWRQVLIELQHTNEPLSRRDLITGTLLFYTFVRPDCMEKSTNGDCMRTVCVHRQTPHACMKPSVISVSTTTKFPNENAKTGLTRSTGKSTATQQ